MRAAVASSLSLLSAISPAPTRTGSSCGGADWLAKTPPKKARPLPVLRIARYTAVLLGSLETTDVHHDLKESLAPTTRKVPLAMQQHKYTAPYCVGERRV